MDRGCRVSLSCGAPPEIVGGRTRARRPPQRLRPDSIAHPERCRNKDGRRVRPAFTAHYPGRIKYSIFQCLTCDDTTTHCNRTDIILLVGLSTVLIPVHLTHSLT